MPVLDNALSIDGRDYHAACVQCFECNRVLTVEDTIYTIDGGMTPH